jgi:RimJ/RimL family protein N-acetyltransferase
MPEFSVRPPTEAARAALAWAVDEHHLVRVWASTDIRHVRSHRVMEKLGMVREVIRTSHHVARDGIVDDVVFSVGL